MSNLIISFFSNLAFKRISHESVRDVVMVKTSLVEIKDGELKALANGKLKDNVIHGFIHYLLSLHVSVGFRCR